MSRERKAQAAAVAAILVIGIAALLGRDVVFGRAAAADGATRTGAVPSLRRVLVRAPERRTIQRVVRLPADIVAWQEATLAARVTGYVKSIAVDVGSRVAANAPIAVLDVPDLEAALEVSRSRALEAAARIIELESALASAKAGALEAGAESGAARAAVERTLAERGNVEADHAYRKQARDRLESAMAASPSVVSQESVDEARGKEAMARASVAVAVARIEESKALVALAEAREAAARTRVDAADAAIQGARCAELAAKAGVVQSERMLGFATLSVPFAGIVTARFVDPGDLVLGASGADRGALVVRVVDTSTVRVRFRVSEPDSGASRKGNSFRLVVDALAGREFRGRVERVSEALDLETRTMVVEGDVVNGDGALRAGMFGRVFLDLESHGDALVVPTEAVTTAKRKSSVLVVEEGRVAKRAIRIGADDGITVEVLDGLKGGESVITTGKDLVVDGDRVEAVLEPKK